jgi:hypothetical protein
MTDAELIERLRRIANVHFYEEQWENETLTEAADRLSALEPGAQGEDGRAVVGDTVRDEMAVFHNRLRRLLNIDKDELEKAGVELAGRHGWEYFRDDPFRWFIRADDERAKKVWAIVEKPR